MCSLFMYLKCSIYSDASAFVDLSVKRFAFNYEKNYFGFNALVYALDLDAIDRLKCLALVGIYWERSQVLVLILLTSKNCNQMYLKVEMNSLKTVEHPVQACNSIGLNVCS